jgi:pimeloyl-ACP methyl ester carboxylesterase
METQLMPGLMNANHVMENWINDFVYMKEHFDWGVLTYTLHPYVIGRGHRMMALEKLLKAVARAAAPSSPWRTPRSSTTSGPVQGVKTFRSHDGFEIAYYVDDFTDPWTTPDTVLLLHAAMGSSRRWFRWVPRLARSFRVVRMDLRGHGDSQKPEARAAVLARPAGR